MSTDGRIAADLCRAGVSTLHEVMGRTSLCRGVRLLVGPPFAGLARTVAIPAGDNLGLHVALEDVPEGSVVCVASGGGGRFAVMGELVATVARSRGVAAMVIDDGIRDLDRLVAPPSVAARDVTPQGTVKRRWLSIGEPIGLGGVLIRPGDWVVGDADGICVIPPEAVGPVLHRAAERDRKEDSIRTALEGGATTVEALGLADLIAGGRSSE